MTRVTRGPAAILCGALAVVLGMAAPLLAKDPPVKEQPAKPAAEKAPAKTKTPLPARVKNDFIRVQRDDAKEPLAMETAIVRYVPGPDAKPEQKIEGLTVDLVGVVHVGEKDYYEQLNKELAGYEALLYELVAPPSVKPVRNVKRGGDGNVLQLTQDGMKDALGLSHQLDGIDYSQENFVHADMTPEQMVESFKKKKESFGAMFLRAIGHGLAKQTENQGLSEMELFAALAAGDKVRVRRVMAKQMMSTDQAMAIFEGEEGGTLISERNKVAFEVLKGQIASGKRNLGVFYGAGHMPDLELKLKNELGLVRSGDPRWLEAWNLRDDAGK